MSPKQDVYKSWGISVIKELRLVQNITSAETQLNYLIRQKHGRRKKTKRLWLYLDLMNVRLAKP